MDSLTAPTEEIIIPAEGGPSELVLVKRNDPVTIFTDSAFVEVLLARIETAAKDFTADVTTEKGRKKIASQAYRIAQTKTYLDGMGKDAVAVLKELPKLVDAGRKTYRDRLDALKDEVRKPLTDHEARVAALEARLKNMRELPNTMQEACSEQIQSVARMLATTPTDASEWDEFAEQATQAKEQTTAALNDLYEKRKQQEDDQAELDRLREEKRKREEEETANRHLSHVVATIAASASQKEVLEQLAVYIDPVTNRSYDLRGPARVLPDFQALPLVPPPAAPVPAPQTMSSPVSAPEQAPAPVPANEPKQIPASSVPAVDPETEHRRTFNREAWADIQAVILAQKDFTNAEATATEIVKAIITGKVRHIAITY